MASEIYKREGRLLALYMYGTAFHLTCRTFSTHYTYIQFKSIFSNSEQIISAIFFLIFSRTPSNNYPFIRKMDSSTLLAISFFWLCLSMRLCDARRLLLVTHELPTTQSNTPGQVSAFYFCCCCCCCFCLGMKSLSLHFADTSTIWSCTHTHTHEHTT